MVYGFMVNGGAHEEQTKGPSAEGGQTPDGREGGDQTRSARARQARKNPFEIGRSSRLRRSKADASQAAIRARQSAGADPGAGSRGRSGFFARYSQPSGLRARAEPRDR